MNVKCEHALIPFSFSVLHLCILSSISIGISYVLAGSEAYASLFNIK